jgi:hypothetical protein
LATAAVRASSSAASELARVNSGPCTSLAPALIATSISLPASSNFMVRRLMLLRA